MASAPTLMKIEYRERPSGYTRITELDLDGHPCELRLYYG
jgi:hypothetical protein